MTPVTPQEQTALPRRAGGKSGDRPVVFAQHAMLAIHHEPTFDMVLALADRVFALDRGAVFHEGPASRCSQKPCRKQILWV